VIDQCSSSRFSYRAKLKRPALYLRSRSNLASATACSVLPQIPPTRTNGTPRVLSRAVHFLGGQAQNGFEQSTCRSRNRELGCVYSTAKPPPQPPRNSGKEPFAGAHPIATRVQGQRVCWNYCSGLQKLENSRVHILTRVAAPDNNGKKLKKWPARSSK